MPLRCVEALRHHRVRQAADKEKAGARWIESNLVFASAVGTPLDAHNVRRAFGAVAAGLDAGEWTPREMRHSFVSLLSDSGLPIEHIARPVRVAAGPAEARRAPNVLPKLIFPLVREVADDNIDVAGACTVLNVSRSGYYD
jgi:integrase